MFNWPVTHSEWFRRRFYTLKIGVALADILHDEKNNHALKYRNDLKARKKAAERVETERTAIVWFWTVAGKGRKMDSL